MDKLQIMNIFLTGSRAYGIPNNDSDVDIALLVPSTLASFLWQFSENKSVKFGKLNLILFVEEEEESRARFARWREVTERLITRSPVSRDEAIAEFQSAGFSAEDYLMPS